MSTQIKSALEASQVVVRDYVRNLEGENVRLQRQIAKLECNNMSYKNRVASLQNELSKYLKKGHITVRVNRNVGAKN